MALRLALIEDDALIRDCYFSYLRAQPELTCLFAAGSVEEFFEQAAAHRAPHVVLTDIGLPGKSGLEGIRLIKQQFPEADVLMFTVYGDSSRIFQAVCAGASGYLLKNTPLADVKRAVLDVAGGGSVMSPTIARQVLAHFRPQAPTQAEQLTERERQTIQLLVDGMSYKLAADRLGVTLDTIRNHVRNIYRKLHINSKGELINRHFRGEI